MQRLLRRLRTTFLVKYLIYIYLRILFLTYRLEVIDEAGQSLPINKSTGLYCMWQEHSLAGLFFLYKHRAYGHLMTDSSPDGLVASFVSRRLGFIVMETSTKPSTMKRAVDALDTNRRMFVVGDGQGHARKLQRHVPYLSARTGVPVVFIECSASSALSLSKRWDSFKIPLPFSTITVKIHPGQHYAFDQEHHPAPVPAPQSE